MIETKRITPALGAEIFDVDFSHPLETALQDAVYQALVDNLVIFFRNTGISPAQHLEFARTFGELDAPHPLYPHVERVRKHRTAGKTAPARRRTATVGTRI